MTPCAYCRHEQDDHIDGCYECQRCPCPAFQHRIPQQQKAMPL